MTEDTLTLIRKEEVSYYQDASGRTVKKIEETFRINDERWETTTKTIPL
jgi:hypothetical protein